MSEKKWHIYDSVSAATSAAANDNRDDSICREREGECERAVVIIILYT